MKPAICDKLNSRFLLNLGVPFVGMCSVLRVHVSNKQKTVQICNKPSIKDCDKLTHGTGFHENILRRS